MNLKPNCFEKIKVRWGIFSFFLPQMLKRRTSALLPITSCFVLLITHIQHTLERYAKVSLDYSGLFLLKIKG